MQIEQVDLVDPQALQATFNALASILGGASDEAFRILSTSDTELAAQENFGASAGALKPEEHCEYVGSIVVVTINAPGTNEVLAVAIDVGSVPEVATIVDDGIQELWMHMLTTWC